MYVEQLMTRGVVTVGQNTFVGHAWKLMQEAGFRHLPVVNCGRLVGIVSDRDLRVALANAAGARALDDAWLWHTPMPEPRPHEEMLPKVSFIMRRSVVTVEPFTPIEEASRLLLEQKIGALPVVAGDQLVGIVTESDLFRMLVDLLGLKAPSTRLQFALTRPTEQLAEVTRIARELDVPIVSLITEPGDGGGSITAVLRIGTIAPEPYIRRLEDAGINIYRPLRSRPPEMAKRDGAA